MDSITQAALGAAVGEAVLGKKLGNKAILVGAIAGTIPDLDVLSRLFIDNQIYGLIYHRGITHSIFFTLVASPIFAWLSLQYYKRGWHKKKEVQGFLAAFWGLIYLAFLTGFGALVYFTPNLFTIFSFVGMLALGRPIIKTLYNNVTYLSKTTNNVNLKEWTAMYFFAFLTHWIIDACTAYGTQIFEPFSSYRVAFNNISIVDPLYTVPLLLGLGIAFFAKKYTTRRFWNRLGISLSSIYMVSTFYAKSIMNEVVSTNLAEQNIEATAYITYPSLFNTILWQTTVETADAYYYGNYSFFDKEPKIQFTKLPKNHNLVEKYKDDESVKILLWFAQGYYNVVEKEDGSLMLHNLRFGLLGIPKESKLTLNDRYIFKFSIKEKEGSLLVEESRDIEKINPSTLAPELWRRMWGQ